MRRLGTPSPSPSVRSSPALLPVRRGVAGRASPGAPPTPAAAPSPHHNQAPEPRRPVPGRGTAREALRAAASRSNLAQRRGRKLSAPQIARGCARRPVEAPSSQLADELTRFSDARHRLIARIGTAPADGSFSQQIQEVNPKERRPEQCRFGHTVIAVGDRPKPQQELPVEWVLQEQRPTARSVGDAHRVETWEQERKSPRGYSKDSNIPLADGP